MIQLHRNLSGTWSPLLAVTDLEQQNLEASVFLSLFKTSIMLIQSLTCVNEWPVYFKYMKAVMLSADVHKDQQN